MAGNRFKASRAFSWRIERLKEQPKQDVFNLGNREKKEPMHKGANAHKRFMTNLCIGVKINE